MAQSETIFLRLETIFRLSTDDEIIYSVDERTGILSPFLFHKNAYSAATIITLNNTLISIIIFITNTKDKTRYHIVNRIYPPYLCIDLFTIPHPIQQNQLEKYHLQICRNFIASRHYKIVLRILFRITHNHHKNNGRYHHDICCDRRSIGGHLRPPISVVFADRPISIDRICRESPHFR